jgi:hypothetical protein
MIYSEKIKDELGEKISILKNTRDITLKYFDLGKEDLSKTYAPGKWSIKKILVHLADAESVLHERIKRIISDPKQIIWAFDQDVWCSILDYENYPIDLSRSLFLSNRNSVLYFIEKYYNGSGEIQFIHSESGLKTLKDVFDYIPFHNKSHIDQINLSLKSTGNFAKPW